VIEKANKICRFNNHQKKQEDIRIWNIVISQACEPHLELQQQRDRLNSTNGYYIYVYINVRIIILKFQTETLRITNKKQ
jgi:hypothetical protein